LHRHIKEPKENKEMKLEKVTGRRKFLRKAAVISSATCLTGCATQGKGKAEGCGELFGDDGFEQMVDRVAGIEKQLGIYDLAKFTPR
jgi:hypothetical protein